MNMEAVMGMRVMAWSRLLKVFGVLRWDDLQRLRPRELATTSTPATARPERHPRHEVACGEKQEDT